MTRPSLPAALAGLGADIDQQQALCVDLLNELRPAEIDRVCKRFLLLCEHDDAMAKIVGHFAALGLMVATAAWQQREGE